MPTTLDVAAHLDALREALLAFTRYADRAGLRAAVPTCPDWRVRDLVAHQGMVHRWAAGLLTGQATDTDALEREGRSAVDPLEWLRDGAIELATALTRAPETVAAPVFLKDAPAPRAFWARRQCHETTIHAIDAMAASLGVAPAAGETWIRPETALDGVDELLCGFLPRSKSRLRSPTPLSFAVRPHEGDRGWLVQVTDEPAVTTVLARDDASLDAADVTVDGSAVELYLQLWNRSAAPGAGDPGDGMALWREKARITWA
ncbi:maleylpyruvate isomerase N-terminal domain-containing protein [Nocardioides jiangxiensis]|uniref:Maleylpyruvate isomerase N-terminal domain-containing protein n=1 Tax=Nocardioides jiangxiensis TaxID=3064524 RepID=A0ABT9B0F0_9ACTN|nr:maleylpyruvate isomerase N-terminal domain-containing protein [Nocardioides sp. WY-20]MDO7868284.1 maleylpyruvate isomerase N-terminal domain-containing protein [Nocardioides sp. WY-20]